MEFVFLISKNFSCSPFEILNADTSYVILCINYFLEKAYQGNKTTTEPQRNVSVYYEKDGTKVTRKKVTNATANWW
jgi:hypothetical protein